MDDKLVVGYATIEDCYYLSNDKHIAIILNKTICKLGLVKSIGLNLNSDEQGFLIKIRPFQKK